MCPIGAISEIDSRIESALVKLNDSVSNWFKPRNAVFGPLKRQLYAPVAVALSTTRSKTILIAGARSSNRLVLMVISRKPKMTESPPDKTPELQEKIKSLNTQIDQINKAHTSEINSLNSRLLASNYAEAVAASKLQEANDKLTDDGKSTLYDKERDRCLKLAQSYEESWQRLREHEWRLEIAFWGLLLACIGLFAGGVSHLFGSEISAPRLPEELLNNLPRSLICFWVLSVMGKIGYQLAFEYYAKNRDYYIRQSCAAVCPTLYQWSEPKMNWCDPRTWKWHVYNRIAVILYNAAVTGMLLFTCNLLINKAAAKESKPIFETINGTVETISMIPDHDGVLLLRGGTKIVLPPGLGQGVPNDSKIEVIAYKLKEKGDLRAVKLYAK